VTPHSLANTVRHRSTETQFEFQNINSLQVLVCTGAPNSGRLNARLAMFLDNLKKKSSHEIHVTFRKIPDDHSPILTNIYHTSCFFIKKLRIPMQGCTVSIYRTLETLSSHPGTRLTERPAAYVTSCGPGAAYASFASKGAMIRNNRGVVRPAVIEFGIRMTVHKLRCVCVFVCGSDRIGLIQRTLLLLGSLGPN
jgi:hypothetical protein